MANFDPISFYTSGLDLGSELGIQIPRYGTDYSQIAFGTEPTSMAPTRPTEPKSLVDYINYGAELAETVRDAYARFKGFPVSPSTRSAGERLGRFMQEEKKKEQETSKQRTQDFAKAIQTVFSNPEVIGDLVDIFNNPVIKSAQVDPGLYAESLKFQPSVIRRFTPSTATPVQ